MNDFIMGDRVRCNHGGRGFPGLHGTITEISEDERHGQYALRVKWDNPPSKDERDCSSEDGGTWGVTSLDLLARLKDGTEVGYGDRLTFEEGRDPSVYFDGDYIPEGLVVTVGRVYHSADSANVLIDLKTEEFEAINVSLDQDEYGWPVQGWNPEWFTAVEAEEPEPEEFGRPLVHFDDTLAGRDRSKARAACAEAVSRVLPPPINKILRAAADGESVDAYALNEALTKALRSAVTRHGQSAARREQAKRFAHVAHIVQAVLENHADNLPGYEPGARSRVVEDLKTEVAEAKRAIDHNIEVNQRLTADLTEARAQRERMADEARSLRAEIERATQIAEAYERNSTEAWAEVARMAKVLDYTRAECVDNEAARQKSFGFEDGIKA